MNEYKDIEFSFGFARPLDISINTNAMTLDIGIESGGGGQLPPYGGEYVVTPKPFIEQTLETKNKSMSDDVTVLEIPYSVVTNPQGGKTANIGFEL